MAEGCRRLDPKQPLMNDCVTGNEKVTSLSTNGKFILSTVFSAEGKLACAGNIQNLAISL